MMALAAGTISTQAFAANYVVSSEAELRAAIDTANADSDPASTITLTNNIELADSAPLSTATKPLTIATGVYTLSGLDASGTDASIGATFNDGSFLTITGTVSGGNAGAPNSNATGGTAITTSGGSVENVGAVTGGTGGQNNNSGGTGRHGGTGGSGMALTNVTLVNQASGDIVGGNGGNYDAEGAVGAGSNSGAGAGGVGVVMVGGSLDNRGTISGGNGGVASNIPAGADNVFSGAGGTGASLSGGNHVNSGTIIGGQPGVGMNQGGSGHGAGGNGVALADGAVLVNDGNIIGWDGLNGGGTTGGTGSAGGAGAIVADSTLENHGTITAGNSGATAGGGGGIGISGTNASVINSGIIDPGVNGNGTIANAIQFGGTENDLELRSGSTINGNVVANGTDDTLALGGSTNDSFDVTQIGAAAQYRGFEAFEKRGASIWTLTGTTTETTPWTLLGGTLSVSEDGNLGSAAGDLTFNGGTLQVTGAVMTGTARDIIWGDAGGGFDIADATHTFTVDDDLGSGGSLGGLTKQGAGTLVLTGTNAYTGGTTIAAGTLQLGDGGATGSIVGDIANNGTLAINRNNAITLDGDISGTGGLQQNGTGTTILTGENTYTGGTTITAGTLQLGNGGTTGAITGDVVNDGTLAFNRSDDVTFAGAISGTGAVIKDGGNALLLTGTNTYTGATSVNSGTLRAGAANVFSAASAHSIAAGTTLDLNGFSQSVGGLNNAGTVQLLSASPGVQLTVNGDYTGNNGVLQMGVELGGNASPTDRLIITGNASGNTTVELTNLGGLGAQTTGNGIELISVGGTTTADAFVLAGDHVDAGAYEYRLFAGSGDSNWYLRSLNNAATAFRPEVALNAALPGLLAQSDLAMLSTLHQRVGDNSAASAAQEARHVWGRMIGQRVKTEHGGDVAPSTEGSFTGLQIGSDLLQLGLHRFGVYGGYLHGDSNVRGFASGMQHNRVGDIDLENKYFGAYWTYQNDAGWYTDTVLQQVWYDGETNSLSGGDNDIEGHGTQLSFEAGKSIPLNATWMLEPQAQLIVGWMNIDDQRISGAEIDQDSDTTLTSRIGVRLKGDYTTSRGRLQPYGRFNVWHGSNGAYTMTFAGPAGGTDIRTDRGYTAGQIALGLTWAVNDRFNVYGEVGHMVSLDNDDQQVRQPVMANVGLRLDW